MKLQGKKILICISGGIAAYKINFLIRDFIKKGADVQVLMTPSAEKMVSKLTLSTLSKNPVYTEFYSENGTWNNHVDLALSADVILMAPCTANTLAKLVHGMCDNLVLATYMSAKCPVFIAPAMDLEMYQHPSTKQNLELAEDFGHHIIPAEHGELASGLSGQGRMAEPETIAQIIEEFFNADAHKDYGVYSNSTAYQGTLKKINDADMVIIDVSVPSMTMGVLLANAQLLKKPCLLLTEEKRGDDQDLFVAGATNSHFTYEIYTKATLPRILKTFLLRGTRKRTNRVNFVLDDSTLSRLDWLAFRLHASKTEVVSRAIDSYDPND